MPPLCRGEILGAFGLTEPEAGSDAGNTQTRAVLEDGEWVINGTKQFITNAGADISGLVVITAVLWMLDGGRGLFFTTATAFSVLQQFATIGPIALGLGLSSGH